MHICAYNDVRVKKLKTNKLTRSLENKITYSSLSSSCMPFLQQYLQRRVNIWSCNTLKAHACKINSYCSVVLYFSYRCVFIVIYSTTDISHHLSSNKDSVSLLHTFLTQNKMVCIV